MKGSLDRHAIKSSIKFALRPDNTMAYDDTKKWPSRFYDRLTALAIYSCCDKKNIPYQSFAYLQRWSMGWEYKEIAVFYDRDEGTIRNGMSRVLDFIIDNVNPELLINMPVSHYVLHPIVTCPRNDGQLLWDDFEGCYICIQCSRHYNANLMLIGH